MTTHELAKKLLDGPDVMVTRGGKEGGFIEIESAVGPDLIKLNYYSDNEWWYGPHMISDDGTIQMIALW